MKLTLGFSPCPNDTFIFDAMVHGKVDTYGLEFEYILEDVEKLNTMALNNELDITKLSFNTFLHCADDYALFKSGSALGRGVGPLLVSKKERRDKAVKEMSIAIPGVNTTANLLLSLAFPEAVNKKERLFSEIEGAVLSDEFDAGLLIHENRFTYQQKGLNKIIDLGDWWEQTANAAIPLGGIVAKRTLNSDIISKVDAIIKSSVAYAWESYPELSEFVTCHAQEMEEEVMRQHINLYVNEYTTDLGEEGTRAIKVLFDKAVVAKVITAIPEKIFY